MYSKKIRKEEIYNIEDLGTKYSVTQEIFVSYSRQREKAYANYR